MRRFTTTTVSLLALGALAATMVWAGTGSPHFVKGPTASLDTTTGDYTVSFKESGLGNTPITYVLTAATENFTFQCFNHGGNNPQGAPNSISFSNVSVQTTLTPTNGNITGSISLLPQLDGASCQGGGLELFLIAVNYEGVTFEDSTTPVGPIAMPNLSASGLKIGPF